MSEMTATDDLGLALPLGGIRESDVLIVGDDDGRCSRCREAVPEEEVPLLLWTDESEPGGAGMYRYCTRCAFDPESDRCGRCGCTDRYSCDGGCGWARPGLCTRCAEEEPGWRPSTA